MCLSDLTAEPRVITEAAPPYRVVHVNQAWLKATGYSQEQMLGGTCRMLQGADTCQRTMQVCALRTITAMHASTTLPYKLPPHPIPTRAVVASQVLHNALRCFRPITVRLLNYRANGSPFVNDLTVLPILDPVANVATHFLGIMKDRSLPLGVPPTPPRPADRSCTCIRTPPTPSVDRCTTSSTPTKYALMCVLPSPRTSRDADAWVNRKPCAGGPEELV